jgi:oxygen-dependent protoporphyrinogen oxidase
LAAELVAPRARRAYVWARGRLRPLPAGLALGVPTRLVPLARSGICSPAGLVRPALDLLRRAPGSVPAVPGADLAVGEVVTRHLGREVAARLAGPLIGGIHAGAIETMSTAAVFPALLEAEGRGGSLMRALRATRPERDTVAPGAGADGEAPVFLTVRGGLGRMVDALARALEQRGVELRRSSPVGSLVRAGQGEGPRWSVRAGDAEVEADGVVVTVPSPEAAALLRPHDEELADALDAVVYSSVALVTLLFADDAIDHPLDGSGFLVPRTEGHEPDPLVTACTWLTSKWPELRRPGGVLVRASVGRHGDERHQSLGDDVLVTRCLAELGAMMGVRRSPVEALVTRWPQAFPQYAVGHPARVRTIEACAARLPSIAVAGAALHGVGIPACIGSGRRAARGVLDAVGAASSGMAR